MCHGHPHIHGCGHQSMTWHYCPSALIDLETGYETACSNVTFAAPQPSNAACVLINCDYRSGGTGWTCCNCGGRNTSGWCKNMSPNPKWEKNTITNEWEWIETCDHGCCRNCAKDPSSNYGEPSRKDGKRSKDSRKHRHRTQGEAGSSSAADPMASYNITLDYSSKESRGLSRKEGKSSSGHKKK
ncbi:hypothetical protein QC761_204180 [Podospora bellae-mahoneyi]|uniref:Uncharacterized protein n=1 Tax=Podospora bellae-mahoneyi TaxID=2093777 RepID=A0ABR0FP22_9PEZI|nr:hypothetical protein QC761_204180 [Podospora bellae-mahoneyi]